MRRYFELVVAAVLAQALGATSFAATTTVYNVTQFKNALNAAGPGDRIYVAGPGAGGSYTSRVWVSGRHGAAGNMIEVVALDPTDRAMFTVQDDSCITFYNCSYIMVDGIMAQGAGTSTSAGNNIEFPNSHHMILKNSYSGPTTNTGNADGLKFADSNNILVYRCSVEDWGAGGGSAVDLIGTTDSLMMRNRFIYHPVGSSSHSFAPKRDSVHMGFYKNYFEDGGGRAQQFGGCCASVGPEAWDQVSMGNVIENSEASVAYVSCTDCLFSYNTLIEPESYVMRILNESGYGSDYNTFKRNLVYYGNITVQGIGSGNNAASFTYERNYWYKWTNPGSSIPTLAAPEIDPAGGINPQLDSDGRPHYDGAKDYGVFAPAMESQFEQYQSWFQWSWDKAQQFEPKADPGDIYQIGPGQMITLDASGSTAGSGSYENDPGHPEWHHTITDYRWDLDFDSDFDDATGQTVQVSYEDVTGTGPGQLGLETGWHTIELKILVSTGYGTIDDWGFAQLHILAAPVPGDLDGDGDVDLDDLVLFVDAMNGPNVPPGNADADLDADNDCDLADAALFAANFTGP